MNDMVSMRKMRPWLDGAGLGAAWGTGLAADWDCGAAAEDPVAGGCDDDDFLRGGNQFSVAAEN